MRILPPLDPEKVEQKIAAMRQWICQCGSRYEITLWGDSAVDLKCINSKCKSGYHIPLRDRDQLRPPGSVFLTADKYVPAKSYRCKSCKVSIQEDQALRTFEEIGSAMCNECELKEMND